MLLSGTALSLALFAVLGFAPVAAEPPLPPADRIWLGDHILTMTDDQPRAEAIAIRDGRILAVGDRNDVLQHRGSTTDVVELGDRALLPGFVDAHGHAFMIGIQALSANLLPPPDGGVSNIADLQASLREWDESNRNREQPLGLVLGFGYDDAQLAEQRHPTRTDLDAVSTTLPVLIIHQSGHIGVVNSKALQLLGIEADTPDPEGGVIRREAGSSQPNGVLEESAFFKHLAKQFGRLDTESAQALFVAGTELLASYGYTTGQEGRSTHALVPLMQEAAAEGKIPIDVVTYIDVMDNRDHTRELASQEYVNGFRIGGAKLTIDGSPQGFTAFRDRPYYRAPEQHRADYHGYPAVTADQVFDAIEWAFRHNVQIITHANGEAAADLLIAAVGQAQQQQGKADRRPVLIHGQFLRRDQVAALDRLDIFPSLFPMHTFYWGDWHRDRTVGPELADHISPTGWVLERGMKFSTHHDAPVAFPDSMRVLAATVTRRSRSGDILGPEHRVDPMTALKAMTLWPAWQHFEEHDKGSLLPGKVADLVILSQDPTAVDPETLSTLLVLETIKSGKSIHQQDQQRAPMPPSPKAERAVGDVVSRMLDHMQHSSFTASTGTPHSHGPNRLTAGLHDAVLRERGTSWP